VTGSEPTPLTEAVLQTMPVGVAVPRYSTCWRPRAELFGLDGEAFISAQSKLDQSRPSTKQRMRASG